VTAYKLRSARSHRALQDLHSECGSGHIESRPETVEPLES
jgi:hypothetical protein